MLITGDGCTVRTHLMGSRVAQPIATSLELAFSDTPVDGLSVMTAPMRNVTDDALTVEVRSTTSDFVVPVTRFQIGPREPIARAVNFLPTAVGDFVGGLEVRVGSSSRQIVLRGHGGGPRVSVADVDLGPMSVFYGAHELERRVVLVRNTGDPAEGARSDWTWSGLFAASCSEVSVLGAPVRVPGGEALPVLIEFTPQFGLQHCDLLLSSTPRPVSFRVQWEGVGVAPCDLMMSGVAIDPVTHRGTWSITNRSERCLLSGPRLEPFDAGSIDVTWQWLWLEGGQTVQLPITAHAAADAIIYVADPISRSRRVSLTF
ncbi:MAG: hypothetical protein QM817_06720 [Archangium sp.]